MWKGCMGSSLFPAKAMAARSWPHATGRHWWWVWDREKTSSPPTFRRCCPIHAASSSSKTAKSLSSPATASKSRIPRASACASRRRPSTGPRRWRKRKATRTSCSRKSMSNRAIRDTLRGRIGTDDTVTVGRELGKADFLAGVERLQIVGMGTSLHAAQVGKFMIESLARVPVEVDNASEFRYRDPIITPKSLVIGISQSGETADTLAAMKEAREKGARLLSICNVVGSQAARQSDAVLYTHAGPEIGVASTKAFITQLTALYLLALELAQLRRTLPQHEIQRHVRELRDVPDQIRKILEGSQSIAQLAERFWQYSDFLYLGRGTQLPDCDGRRAEAERDLLHPCRRLCAW